MPFQYAASKKSVLTDPNFFLPKNHNSIQVHMVDEIFLSINLVLTAVKLLNIGNLTLFSFNLLSEYGNVEINYYPHFNMWKVITFHILKRGK